MQGLQLRLVLFSVVLLVLSACSPSGGSTVSDLPAGDMGRGTALFAESISGAPACSTCHTLDGSTLVGPSVQGYAAVAETRVADQSALDYTYTSIMRPAAFIVGGFANNMYNQYQQRLSPQQLADLIAYLLTL
ncbi:MAG: cytochrome c [Chloroflexota bacterium]|nr:cytochrome c [Chloroflexota bacterium]